MSCSASRYIPALNPARVREPYGDSEDFGRPRLRPSGLQNYVIG